MSNSQTNPHVHAELIKAWADGAIIEYFNVATEKWFVIGNPGWSPLTKYRIQPEQSDIEKYGVEKGDVWSMRSVTWAYFVVNKSDTSLQITALFERVVTEVPYKELNTLLFRRGVVDRLGGAV